MSDIALDRNLADIALLLLVIGAPGLALGAILGAVAWWPRRWWGAALGAVAGFAVWLSIWYFFR
jgi:hypothetical protein